MDIRPRAPLPASPERRCPVPHPYATLGFLLVGATWGVAHLERQSAPQVIVVVGTVPAPTTAVVAPQSVPTATPPAQIAATTQPPRANTTEQPVLVRWGTHWYPGQVLGHACGQLERIRFDGYGPEWEQLAGPGDLRHPSQGAVAVDESEDTPTLDPQARVTRGMHLDASYSGTWYPATVLSVERDGRVRIRYDGYGAEWDETVPRTRLRPRSANSQAQTREGAIANPGRVIDAQTALESGQVVHVRSGPSWYGARVQGLACDGHVRIRYNGYGRVWDETVPRDRVRLP